MSNDRFPNGWGNDEDDDYSNPFGSDNDDEEDESSPWAVKKAEQKSDETSTDNSAPIIKNNTGSAENTADNPVKFTDNISNTTSQQSGQPINNYQHQPHKSDVNKVLIAVIALLAAALVGGGAFVLINFRKDKDDKLDSDSVSIGEISATSETEAAVTETATENTTPETTQETDNDVDMVEIDSFYLSAVSDTIYKAVSTALVEMDEEGYKLKGYYIVSSEEKYNYNIPDDFDVDIFISKAKNYLTKSLIDDYNWFLIINDDSCVYANVWTDENTYGYHGNDKGLMAHLNKDDNDTVSDVFERAKAEEDYVKSKNEPETESPTEPPTQKPTEKQSETMSYYTSVSYGIINTKNDPLNMRSAPDTSSEIIYKVPIGAGVELLGESGSWYYARFILRDVAGDYSYEGYLSKEFVRTTSAQIISLVPKNGQINCHGVEVAGFTTNYIALGEPVSLIRKSLGDGWHITAKNMCVNHGVTWYELWNSDDGDYYGWVDSNYVDLDL